GDEARRLLQAVGHRDYMVAVQPDSLAKLVELLADVALVADAREKGDGLHGRPFLLGPEAIAQVMVAEEPKDRPKVACRGNEGVLRAQVQGEPDEPAGQGGEGL